MNFHLVQELGVDPREKPSPWVAADLVVRDVRDRCDRPADPVSARIRVAVGGLALRRRRPARSPAASAARFTRRPVWWASLRQLVFGARRDRGHLRCRHPRRFGHCVTRTLSVRAGVGCAVASPPARSRIRHTSSMVARTTSGRCSVADAATCFDDTVVGGLSAHQLRPGSSGLLRHQRRPLGEEPGQVLHRPDHVVQTTD